MLASRPAHDPLRIDLALESIADAPLGRHAVSGTWLVTRCRARAPTLHVLSLAE